MAFILEALLGIAICVIGGRIGLRKLLYVTVAALAGFAAVSGSKAFFYPLSYHFSTYTSPANASIISFIILAVIPILLIGYFGRKLIVKLQVTESISPMIDGVLGAGYSLALYIAFLQII